MPEGRTLLKPESLGKTAVLRMNRQFMEHWKKERPGIVKRLATDYLATLAKTMADEAKERVEREKKEKAHEVARRRREQPGQLSEDEDGTDSE